jgi:hypothetical protein
MLPGIETNTEQKVTLGFRTFMQRKYNPGKITSWYNHSKLIKNLNFKHFKACVTNDLRTSPNYGSNYL